MADKENKELSFEENMEKLEKIAKDLEKDDLSLDEATVKFEEGMKISKACKEMLDDAEKKITILLEDGTEKDFIAEE